MNNCKIDFEQKIKIPQNTKDNFILEIDKTWKYCIKISFDISRDTDYLNLFLILKSYAHNNICLAYAIGTSFFDENDKIIVTQKENMSYIKKMDFEKFLEWITYRIKYDWQYNKSKSFYSLLIIFEKNLVTLNNKKYGVEVLSYLRPIYPWDLKWLNYLKKSIEETLLLKKKIIYLEEELKKK